MDQNNSITQTSNETNVDFDKFIFKQLYLTVSAKACNF